MKLNSCELKKTFILSFNILDDSGVTSYSGGGRTGVRGSVLDESGVTSYSGGGRTGVRGSVLKKKINTFVSPTEPFNRLDTGYKLTIYILITKTIFI